MRVLTEMFCSIFADLREYEKYEKKKAGKK